MRRPIAFLVLLVLAALLGGSLAGAATPNDTTCRKLVSGSVSHEELLAYDACRFDKLDAQLAVLRPSTPAPSPTPTTTQTTPPKPTATPTSASPRPAPTSTAGAAFPTAATTGVPAGTTLTAYTGPLTITKAGTVIDAKKVTGDLVIKAADVKITRSQIIGTVATDENSTGYSFSIADSAVAVGERAGTGVGAVNFTATRVHVTGGNRSMNCWHDCTITDSYVHDQFTDKAGVMHESGIRMGSRGVLRHNTIACDAPDVAPDAGCSAALTGYGDFGTVANMTIDNNLFVAGSGGFCAYGGSSAGKPYPDAHDIRFTGNVWQRGTRNGDHGIPVCGYYGPITAFDTAAPGNVWTGNAFDNGTPVAASN